VDGLIGRQAELDRLLDLVTAARAGRGCLTVVHGEPGVGKSRLLRALSNAAVQLGVTVLAGRAVERCGPYRPIVEALIRELDPGLLAHPDLAAHRCMLGALLPGWADEPTLTRVTPLVDPTLAVGEAVLRLLSVVAAESGALMMLDDMHWADPDSLSLLDYLLPALRRSRIAVVVASRSDLTAVGLYRLLAQAPQLPLCRLGFEEQAQLLEHLAGAPLPPPAVEFVQCTADGLPFLIEELFAGLVHSGALTQTTAGWEISGELGEIISVPRTFAALTEQRVRELNEQSRQLLAIAAVLDCPMDWQFLVSCSQADESTVLAAMRDAVQHQLLQPDPNKLGVFRWRHALTRRAVLATMLPAEVVAAARFAAATLDTSPLTGSDLLLAADLWATAGAPNRAAELLLAASRESRRAAALATARSQLDRAQELATPTTELAEEILVERTEVLALAGEAQSALHTGTPALARLATGQRQRLATALARAALTQDHFTAVLELLTWASPDDPQTLVLQAQARFGRAEPVPATTSARAAIDAARSHQRPEVECEAWEILGRVARLTDAAAARMNFQRAADLAAEHRLTMWQTRALHELGTLDMYERAAPDRLHQAYRLALNQGMTGTAAVLNLQTTACICMRDGWTAAGRQAQETIELACRVGADGVWAVGHVFVAHALLARGEHRHAQETIRAATAAAPNSPDVTAYQHLLPGLTAALRGDRAEALRHFDAGMHFLLDTPTAAPTPWWGLRQLLHADDDTPTYPGEAEQTRFCVQATNRAAQHYTAAIIAHRAGHDPGPHRDAANELLTNLHWRLVLHLLAASTGHLAALVEDPAADLRAALATFDDLGETAFADTCRRLLRELGAPVPRRCGDLTTIPAALRALGVTPREMQILRRVAQGQTNLDIAHELYLSPRTVETHISHLLTKTRTTDRGELARLLTK
jgi:DNA-binding CsgD family transcriptional regulator